MTKGAFVIFGNLPRFPHPPLCYNHYEVSQGKRGNMKARVFNLGLVLTVIMIVLLSACVKPEPSITPPSTPTLAERALSRHKDILTTTISEASVDNYRKYGIYASRILAVKYPEIYLKADSLFLETIQTNNGFKKSYEIDNVHSEYMSKRQLEGPPFSFVDVDFEKYEIIGPEEVYPEGYPVLPYLDRRLMPIASTLKPAENKITSLEKAEQYYFKLKENGYEIDTIYLLYCENGNSYIYKDGELIDAFDLSPSEGVKGTLVLVFNENNVWYPLMGRDDTDKDVTLHHIVNDYAKETTISTLSEFELEMAEKLAYVTELSESQESVAMAAAARSADFQEGITKKPFHNVWQNIGNIGWPARLHVMRQLIKNANYLSPIVAYLAAVSEDYQGETKLEAVCEEYLKHAATPRANYAHGHLWMCTLLEYTIDESYRTHTGHCMNQAASIKACLDILQIDSYWIKGQAYEPERMGHDYIYLPQYDVIIDNGRLNRSPSMYHKSVIFKSGPESNPTALDIIIFIEHGSRWAGLQPIEEYQGTLPPKETIVILNFLKELHGDSIKAVGNKNLTVSFDEIVRVLEDQETLWKPIDLR